MQIKTKMANIKAETFIQDYLTLCGVKNIDEYLNPTISAVQDIMLYKNIDKACETAYEFIKQNRKIGILVDEDVDGVCSSAMLYLFLKSLKADVKPFFHIVPKSHGISANSEIKNQIQNIDLLIIPDGSIDKLSAEEFNDKNITIIELDHHITKERENVITVNCNYQNETNHHACGTLVTYKFIQGLCEMFSMEYPNYSDFISLATVADVMDMTEIENRYYTKYFHDTYSDYSYNPFIISLVERFNRNYSPNIENIGWKIAPPLNAVFRFGTREEIQNMFYAFIGTKDNREILNEIFKIKKRQNATVSHIVYLLKENIANTHKGIFVFIKPEYKSLSGLIANKLMSEYNKPTFVLRDNGDTYSGSMRSPFDLRTIINDSKLATASGHEQACGIILYKENYDRFIDFIDGLDSLTNETVYNVTANIEPNDVTLRLAENIEKGRDIWGQGIEKPVFHISLSNPEVTVYRKKTNTIKIEKNGVKFLLFFAKENDIEALTNEDNTAVNLICELKVNEYNSIKTPMGIVKKYEVVQKEKPKINWDEIFK